MGWTKESTEKHRASIIAHYGSEEAWREFMRKAASKGGKAERPNRGFAASRELASRAGQKGGLARKRNSPTSVGFYEYFALNSDQLNNIRPEDFIGLYKLNGTQEQLADLIGRTKYLARELVKALENEKM